MSAKLRIDVSHGLIEVEGTEEFVKDIYNDFKDRIAQTGHKPTTAPSVPAPKADEANGGGEKKRAPVGRNRTGSPPTFVKDLNLVAQGNGPSLKDFCTAFDAKSAKDWNLLFVYFLTKFERGNPVTQDHVYTCYKVLNVKPPSAFSQSLFDTANKKGWVDTKSLTDIRLTMVGENYVDHDFPKKPSAPSA